MALHQLRYFSAVADTASSSLALLAHLGKPFSAFFHVALIF
jgi:hypothetical protein